MVRFTQFGVPVQEKRRCPECHSTSPIWHFLANPVMPNGRDVMCYRCRAKHDAYELVVPQEVVTPEETLKKRKLRSEFASGGFRAFILERDGHACVVCGFSEYVEVHHIVPVSEGGTNSVYNLLSLCPTHHKLAHLGKLTPQELHRCASQATKRQKVT